MGVATGAGGQLGWGVGGSARVGRSPAPHSTRPNSPRGRGAGRDRCQGWFSAVWGAAAAGCSGVVVIGMVCGIGGAGLAQRGGCSRHLGELLKKWGAIRNLGCFRANVRATHAAHEKTAGPISWEARRFSYSCHRFPTGPARCEPGGIRAVAALFGGGGGDVGFSRRTVPHPADGRIQSLGCAITAVPRRPLHTRAATKRLLQVRAQLGRRQGAPFRPTRQP